MNAFALSSRGQLSSCSWEETPPGLLSTWKARCHCFFLLSSPLRQLLCSGAPASRPLLNLSSSSSAWSLVWVWRNLGFFFSLCVSFTMIFLSNVNVHHMLAAWQNILAPLNPGCWVMLSHSPGEIRKEGNRNSWGSHSRASLEGRGGDGRAGRIKPRFHKGPEQHGSHQTVKSC